VSCSPCKLVTLTSACAVPEDEAIGAQRAVCVIGVMRMKISGDGNDTSMLGKRLVWMLLWLVEKFCVIWGIHHWEKWIAFESLIIWIRRLGLGVVALLRQGLTDGVSAVVSLCCQLQMVWDYELSCHWM